MMVEEVIINPDGSTTFTSNNNGNNEFTNNAGSGTISSNYKAESTSSEHDFLHNTENKDDFLLTPRSLVIDPAVFLVLVFVMISGIWYYMYLRNNRNRETREAFFMGMDGDKFNIKLPAAVNEYYEIKAKCKQANWVPGKTRANNNAPDAGRGPSRVLAQALMKRAIADIPIVTLIQKESAGMNKLYAQSMCSVKQWKTYQAAEVLVSTEVEDVRSEAEEVEAGWSEGIWKQALQYHNMLKNKHETEAKQRLELAEKAKAAEEAKKKPKISPAQLQKAKEIAAEKAAEELIKMEEREKESKKSFSNNNNGMKKGFLDRKGKK